MCGPWRVACCMRTRCGPSRSRFGMRCPRWSPPAKLASVRRARARSHKHTRSHHTIHARTHTHARTRTHARTHAHASWGGVGRRACVFNGVQRMYLRAQTRKRQRTRANARCKRNACCIVLQDESCNSHDPTRMLHTHMLHAAHICTRCTVHVHGALRPKGRTRRSLHSLRRTLTAAGR